MNDHDSAEPVRFAGKLPDPVRVHTTEGRLARVTPGRPDRHSRRAFMLGNCMTFAILLARETGWPILALRGREVTASGHRSSPYAFVERSAGWLVDVDGVHNREVTKLRQVDTDLVGISPEDATD